MILGLIIGLLLGAIFYFGQQYRLKKELAKTLTFSPDIRDLMPTLSVSSLVYREMSYFNKWRQQQEKALNDWQMIASQAPLGFLWIDAENRLLWCNQAAQILLQIDRWQPQEIRLLLELVRSYELDQLIEATRSTQQAQQQEWIYYPKTYPIETQNQQNLSQKPKSTALKGYGLPLSCGEIGIFIENRQPLRELSQSRERALSDLTHELRTPLTAISLLAETLEKRLGPPESRWSGQISQEVNHLMTLIQEWLDLSQLQEDPSQHLHVERLSLQILVTDAWTTLEPLAQQKKITLAYRETEPCELEGDRLRLTQVFLNLLDNSLKHSPQPGEIQINVSYQGENVQIDLIDQGSGFAEVDLPHVFERLYRGDVSRTRRTSENELRFRQGSGLGLAIVQQIIQAHQGSIIAQNHPKTGGAWLQVLLPKTYNSTRV